MFKFIRAISAEPALLTCYERDKTSDAWLDPYYFLLDGGVVCDEGVRTCSINATCEIYANTYFNAGDVTL